MLDDYLVTNYEVLASISRTITHNKHPDWEDLLSEVILILLESDREKMEALVARNQMRYWVTRIMLNQYNSSTSPFHYKYRMAEVRHRKGAEEIRFWLTSSQVEDKHEREEQFEAIADAMKTVEWFDRMVTTVYYNEAHSLNTLSAATGISRTTLYKAIKRTRHAIQKEIKK